MILNSNTTSASVLVSLVLVLVIQTPGGALVSVGNMAFCGD